MSDPGSGGHGAAARRKGVEKGLGSGWLNLEAGFGMVKAMGASKALLHGCSFCGCILEFFKFIISETSKHQFYKYTDITIHKCTENITTSQNTTSPSC